jgi:phosphoserine phosphatase RsbU/P
MAIKQGHSAWHLPHLPIAIACASFGLKLPLMPGLFQSDAPEPQAAVEPVPNEFPQIEGAKIAASTYGQRVAGDFYDSLRVSPERILFGLLDVAGRRENNQKMLTAAQEIFRTVGAELFSPADINESEAMAALCHRLNRGLMEAAAGVHSCPAFIACYHEKFGTLCYSNAGHTPGLLRDGGGVTELASTGLPLGLFSHATYDAPTIAIAKSTVLLLVSRGVVARASDDEKAEDAPAEEAQSGLARVEELLRADTSTNAASLCASILVGAGASTRESLVTDDMTALALIRTA